MTSNAELRRFTATLRAHAYHTRFRRETWVEALVWSATDHWLGRGIDRRSALLDALRQMYPSTAARASLLVSVKRNEAARITRDPIVELERADPVSDPLPQPTPLLPFPPRVELPPQPTYGAADLASVLDEFDQIDGDIAFHLSSIARWSPQRQRLIVTAWISRARGLEERVRGNYEAHTRVASIAKSLSQLMKIAWPGQVAALQLDAFPENCTLRVEGQPARVSRTWMELADECEASISFLNESAEARREDEEGWFDAARLDPVASDAEQRLTAIRRRIEELTGPIPFLASVSDLRFVEGEPVRLERSVLEVAVPRLVTLAKELRWLRGSDLIGWGECMGRLRWIAHRHRNEHEGIGTLGTLLDPELVPRSSWAKELGVDVQKSQQKKEKNRLLKVLSETANGPELEAWLGQALSLGDVLPNNKLLEELRPRRDDFLELAETPFSFERNQRGRWRWLRAQLAGATETESTESLAQSASTTEADPAIAEVVVDADLVRLRQKTRGKRALYVSNRNDPDLDTVLCRTFEFQELRRVVLSPNRVDSASESIKRGGVDLVLAATGFLPHKADSVLKSACIAANVKYVRVDRGRPQACQRHLMRELGIS